MKAKMGEEGKPSADLKRSAEEELRLREDTLSRTAPDVDEERKVFDPVMAPMRGGMIGTGSAGEFRIEPPSGEGIDLEALQHRDKALRDTPSDTDPREKSVGQITAPHRGGMR